jgi:hypothetical protein
MPLAVQLSYSPAPWFPKLTSLVAYQQNQIAIKIIHLGFSYSIGLVISFSLG